MQISSRSLAAGSAAPESGEGPTVPAVSPLNQYQIASPDCVGKCVGEQAPERSYAKRLADITARLALKGFSLYPLHNDELLVTQWGMSKTLPSIEAAERFLRMVGGTY